MQQLSRALTRIRGIVLGEAIRKHAVRIPLTTLTNTEVNTGVDLPVGAIITAVFVDVKTVEASASNKTIDVGLLSSDSGGDADGFLDGVSTAALGLTNATLVSTGQTRGVLMAQNEDGSGALVPGSHKVVSTARRVTYTPASDHTELKGAIVIEYNLGL
jgi:hypothetical protein